MAVQKSRKTRSKRNIRRHENSKVKMVTLSVDKVTSEIHKRHFITKEGYYKGKLVYKKKTKPEKENKQN